MKKYTVAVGLVFGAAIGTLIAVLADFSLVVGAAGGASLGLIVGALVALYEKSKVIK